MNFRIWIYFGLATAIIFHFNAVVADDDLTNAFDTSTIIIAAEKDACYRFDVYLAKSREQQIRGLMHVRHLPEFSGMLFIYPTFNFFRT